VPEKFPGNWKVRQIGLITNKKKSIMRNVKMNVQQYLMYFFVATLSISLMSCDDDDDGLDIPEFDPNGSITANDQTISQNTIVVQSVDVEQDSWLAAVREGDENTDNFITETLRIEEGENFDVELMLNDDFNFTGGQAGDMITLKLYADNPDSGTLGVFDPDDDEILDDNDAFVRETIMIMMEEETTDSFDGFDQNADGSLDRNEFSNSFPNNFSNYDVDGDAMLNEDEFNDANFRNADTNNDGSLDQDEFNAGVAGMYGNYAGEEDFGTFDTDADGTLSMDEFREGFSGTDQFGNYDTNADGTIDDSELSEGYFNDFDRNADGTIDADEYNAYNTYTSNWPVNRSFVDYDLNADGSLDTNEFSTSYPNNFNASDLDADGSLNLDEFNASNFANADTNNDDFVDQDEFNAGVAGSFRNYAGEEDFQTFDTDADGNLSNDEFAAGFSGTEQFGTYDANTDNVISGTEYNQGLFNDFDSNLDGGLDENEFNTYNNYTVAWR